MPLDIDGTAVLMLMTVRLQRIYNGPTKTVRLFSREPDESPPVRTQLVAI
ncbi:MAG TPA: hypothetical protein VF014_12400 [Casimicrobiaceae bacterium]|nr:hypothetical protein [Casimicrobiaceae bacterium]